MTIPRIVIGQIVSIWRISDGLKLDYTAILLYFPFFSRLFNYKYHGHKRRALSLLVVFGACLVPPLLPASLHAVCSVVVKYQAEASTARSRLCSVKSDDTLDHRPLPLHPAKTYNIAVHTSADSAHIQLQGENRSAEVLRDYYQSIIEIEDGASHRG